MTVARLDSGFDSVVDFLWLGLPGAQTDGRDSSASVTAEKIMIRI